MANKQRFDYSGLQIDRGIPIPESVANPARSKVALLISRLNIGDSFIVQTHPCTQYCNTMPKKQTWCYD